jgi:hypothetical protein
MHHGGFVESEQTNLNILKCRHSRLMLCIRMRMKSNGMTNTTQLMTFWALAVPFMFCRWWQFIWVERHYDWLRIVHESDGNTCCPGIALEDNTTSDNRWSRSVFGSKTGVVARIREGITHNECKYDVFMHYSSRCNVFNGEERIDRNRDSTRQSIRHNGLYGRYF